MTTPTVNMIAPPTIGGVVTGTPTGTVYTGQPGSVVAVYYPDSTTLAQLGFSPAAPGASVLPIAAVTPGASPWTYTNNNGYAEGMYITGGTVSAVSFVRQTTTLALGAAPPIVTLSPGDKAIVTYSAAPTVDIIPR